MAIRVILQSRLSSTRLPGKALLTLSGFPTVVLAARRAANTGLDTVVATSDHAEDDILAAAVEAAGIPLARGPLEDPLSRFVIAAEGLDPGDIVVRLTADNVFPDGDLVTQVAARVSTLVPYVRVGGGKDLPLPYGVSVEAFTAAALRTADQQASTAFEREHVTPWIRENYGDVVLEAPVTDSDWTGLRATIDTFDDYVRVARVLACSADPVGEAWTDLTRSLATLEHRHRSSPVLPRTDNVLQQGPFVLGTVQLGLDYGAANYQGRPSREGARRILAAAADAGVTHLDTARAYGASEDQLGSVLARGLGEDLTPITKIRPLDDVPDDAPAGWGRAAARSSVSDSLRALGTDHVAGLLTHRARDWHLPGVRDELIETRDAGKASVIGVSLSSPAELLSVIEDPEIGYLQFPFNLLDRRWLAAEVQNALAQRPDMIVTVRSVYLQGLLTAGLDARWPTTYADSAAPTVAAIDRLVSELGRVSRADLAVAYVLSHPWITSVVIGAESPDQVADTAALVRRTPLTPEEKVAVEQTVPAGESDLVDPSRW
jgi:aryl-alcohol dehydrogenase-like predicted oxidoreductase/spore coat polysaccharide biosynthesis protein SpsF (cytidylyltransferase family)